jgi:protein-disulfide isomerase
MSSSGGSRKAVILLALLAGCVRSPVAENQSRPVAGMIGTQPVYEDELTPFIKTELEELKRQEYNLKMRAFDRLVEDRLLAKEAEWRKVTVDALLQAEVDAKAGEASEQEIRAYYEGQKQALGMPLDQVKPQIVQLLKQARRNYARQSYITMLRNRAPVGVLLKMPRIEVAIDTNRMKGNINASVTIVEFSDYQCPFCREAESTVSRLVEEYGSRIRFSYRDVPLSTIHPRAQAAAEAAQCAAEQGKFWPYHDLMLRKSASLDDAALMGYAGEVQLDTGQFKSCFDSGKFREKVQADYQDGVRAGVTGTPTFFINGIVLSGAQPFEEFKKVIARELAEAKEAPAAR